MAQQLTLSLLIVVLLMVERKAIPILGAKLSYQLWWLIPLAVMMANIPQNSTTPIIEISHYIVEFNQYSQQTGHFPWWQLVWAIGAFMILFTGAISSNSQLLRQSLNGLNPKQFKIQWPNTIKLFSSEMVSTPMLMGVLQPKLILPNNFKSIYTESQLELIIEHELCHWRRWDNLINLLVILVLALCWFNPLVWLGYRSFRRLQEISCDADVLRNKSKSQHIEYSKALIICAQQGQHPLNIYSNYTEKLTMFNRINLLKNNTKAKRSSQVTALIIAGLVLCSVAVAHQSSLEPQQQLTSKKGVTPTIRIEPRYPIAAARSKTEGSVVIKFDIGNDGQVEHAIVIESRPSGVFDQEAVMALNQWQYTRSDSGMKNQLVQLDFVMAEDREMPNLIERIQVKP